MTSVAINGLGRIGRAALRIIGETPELELAAVNDLADIDNLIPASTGAAQATGTVLPQYQDRYEDRYQDRFDGLAVRAPVPVGSLVDLCLLTRTRVVDGNERGYASQMIREAVRIGTHGRA